MLGTNLRLSRTVASNSKHLGMCAPDCLMQLTNIYIEQLMTRTTGTYFVENVHMPMYATDNITHNISF